MDEPLECILDAICTPPDDTIPSPLHQGSRCRHRRGAPSTGSLLSSVSSCGLLMCNSFWSSISGASSRLKIIGASNFFHNQLIFILFFSLGWEPAQVKVDLEVCYKSLIHWLNQRDDPADFIWLHSVCVVQHTYNPCTQIEAGRLWV